MPVEGGVMKPFRPLLIVVVGGAALLLTMELLSRVGLDQNYLTVPISVFAALMAIWPLVAPVMQTNQKPYTLKSWTAYQLTVAVVLAIVMFGFHTYSLQAGKIQ